MLLLFVLLFQTLGLQHKLLQDIRHICVVKDAITFCATIPNPWELQQELL
jgi:hypothetical protein